MGGVPVERGAGRIDGPTYVILYPASLTNIPTNEADGGPAKRESELTAWPPGTRLGVGAAGAPGPHDISDTERTGHPVRQDLALVFLYVEFDSLYCPVIRLLR